MTNIYSAKVTPKSGNTLNMTMGLPKIGLEIIKNNSNAYFIVLDELFFKVINPQNIPNGKINKNVVMKAFGTLIHLFYEIKYEENSDITTLDLFV